MIRGGRNRGLIGLVITSLIVLLTYLHSSYKGYLDDTVTHLGYIMIYLLMGLLVSAVLPATSITS